MPVTIRKLQVNKKEPIQRRIMLYGAPNVGKTHLIGSAQDVPELAPLLVGNIDKGTATLLSRGDILAADVAGAGDLEELLWKFIRKDADVAHIRTLVLDGSSELQNLDLAELATEAAKKSDRRDRDLIELQDYKKNMARMMRVIRMARDIQGITLIITAWAGQEWANEQRTGDPVKVFPKLSKAVRDTVFGLMDDVWFLSHDVKSDKRFLYTGPLGPVVARTRDEAVAKQLQTDGKPYIVNPDFKQIYAAYQRAYQQ